MRNKSPDGANPAPRRWPNMMDTALPMANIITQNRFHAVPLMFSAATAFSPREE